VFVVAHALMSDNPNMCNIQPLIQWAAYLVDAGRFSGEHYIWRLPSLAQSRRFWVLNWVTQSTWGNPQHNRWLCKTWEAFCKQLAVFGLDGGMHLPKSAKSRDCEERCRTGLEMGSRNDCDKCKFNDEYGLLCQHVCWC
jgi:hypothetical protein